MEKGRNSKIFSDNPSAISQILLIRKLIKLDKSYCKQILNFEKNKKYIYLALLVEFKIIEKDLTYFRKLRTRLN